MVLRALFFLAAALAAAVLPLRVEGQIVSGLVILAGTEDPLADVTVRLHFPDGRTAGQTLTDAEGIFVLRSPRLGFFTLSAERIGLATTTTDSLEVGLSEEVEVILRMAEEAIPLEPLLVEARSSIDMGPLAGYYQRMSEREDLGFGFILSRDQIEERMALDVADLLREVPRVRVVAQGVGRPPSVVLLGRGGQCTPKVYIDGIHQNRGGAAGTAAVVDEILRPNDLEGIELYRGLGEMPGDFYDEGHCGVILLWSQRSSPDGRPSTWTRIFGAALALGLFALLFMN